MTKEQILKRVVRKIKHWFWWRFQATEDEKAEWQMLIHGTGIMKITKRGREFVDVKKLFVDPEQLID